MYEFYWSEDGESFQNGPFASRQEALEKALDDAIGYDLQVVFVGKAVDISIGEYIPPTWRIVEMMQEEAWDNVGDASSDWLNDLTKEEERDLGEMLKNCIVQWAEKHNRQPSFMRMVDVSRHDVPQAE